MALVKRGKTWHTDFVVHGTRFRQSLQTTDWREAQSQERELIKRAEDGKIVPKDVSWSKLPFTKAADRYIEARPLELSRASQAKERQLLVKPRTFFGEMPLRHISVQKITDYRQWRAVQGVGPATLNAELGILRRILKRAKLWGRLAEDIKPLKEPASIGRDF